MPVCTTTTPRSGQTAWLHFSARLYVNVDLECMADPAILAIGVSAHMWRERESEREMERRMEKARGCDSFMVKLNRTKER